MLRKYPASQMLELRLLKTLIFKIERILPVFLILIFFVVIINGGTLLSSKHWKY